MVKTRAMYLPDARYKAIPIFELRKNYFICITDPEIRYHVEDVIADDDWIIISADEDERNRRSNG